MTFPSSVFLALHIPFPIRLGLCEEFEPRVVLAWQGIAYDLWMVCDMWIGRLLDETATYFTVNIEIDLV